jgi:citrate lyase subunit beta/citryl-CoA lyase
MTQASIASVAASRVMAPLFVPALDERKLAKAVSLAQAVIIDLEDATADSRKAEARQWVSGLGPDNDGKRWVRVNGVDTGMCHDDVVAVAAVASVIVLPKCQGRSDLELAAAAIEEAGGNALLIPIVETAIGIEAVAEIAGAVPGRLVRLALGLGDFSKDMEVVWEPGSALSNHARCRVAIASRAAGLAKPIDSVIPRLDDMDMLRDDIARGRSAGFGGKFCIHPTQLDAVISGFRPSEEELALERRKVEAFVEALARGKAAVVVEGHFIDYPVAELAEARLAAEGRATGLLAPRLSS